MHCYKDYEAIQSSWKMGTFLGLFSTNNYENNCFCKTHPRLSENKMLPVSCFISLVRQLMALTYTTLSTHQAQYVQMPKQMLAINCSDQWNIKRIQQIISKLKVTLHTKWIPSKSRDANSGKQCIANLAGIGYSYLHNLCTMHNAIRNCSCRNTCHPISHCSLGVSCYLCLCIYTTWNTPIIQRTCNLHSPVNWIHL